MENAAKALTMAAGVLIGVIIITIATIIPIFIPGKMLDNPISGNKAFPLKTLK